MRLIVILMTVCLLDVSAAGFAQKISLSKKNCTLQQIFTEIKNHSDLDFLYNPQMLKEANLVDIEMTNASVVEVLDHAFKGQPLTYTLNNKTIIVKRKILPTVIQQKRLKGRVTDNAKQPIPGASVRIKGTDQGTVTNGDGYFSMPSPGKSVTLMVSFIGYKTKELTINGDEQDIQVSLADEGKSLTEIVVLGYQETTRKKATAAISSVRAKDIENLPAPSFDMMLQGKISGVNIQNFSGEPGVRNSFVIRGNTKLSPSYDSNDGYSSPLYIIDGIQVAADDLGNFDGTGTNFLASLNPNDIESVDILKDASAAAIYGARGANGVVLIRTKRGTSGTPSFSFSTYTGVVTKPKLVETLGGATERRMKMALLEKYGSYNNIKNNVPIMLTDSLNPSFNNNNNYQDMFYQPGRLQNYNLTVSGGSDKFNYRVGTGYYNEKGIVKSTGFERISLNSNLGAKLTDRLDLNFGIRLSRLDRQRGNGQGGRRSTFPISPIDMPSSLFYLSDADKEGLLGKFDQSRNVNRNNNTDVSANAQYRITDYLRFTSEGSYSYANNKSDYFLPGSINNGDAYANYYYSQTQQYMLNNRLNFFKTIGKNHNISALIGQEIRRTQNEDISAEGSQIPSDQIKVVSGVMKENLNAATDVQAASQLSYIGSVHYDYKERYLIDANFRADASSRFGANNRWGYFPSVSAGWIVSDEAFMKNLTFVNFLKLRGSWGVNGDMSSIDFYRRFNKYSAGKADFMGSSNVVSYNGVTTVVPNFSDGIAQNNISWEKSKQWNIGAELELFKSRIRIETDVYQRETTGQLFNVYLPITTGYEKTLANAGGVMNQGIELTINSHNLSPKSAFRWDTQFNISYNKNTVTQLPNGNRDYYGDGYVLTVGKPMYQYYMWKTMGIYSTKGDLLVNPLTGTVGQSKWGPFKPGDPIWQDTNGDYILQDSDDIAAQGDAQPRYYGGLTNTFSYKNWTLNIFATFTLGRTIVNNTWARMLSKVTFDTDAKKFSETSMFDYSKYDFWQKEGDQSQYPALNPYRGIYAFRVNQTLYLDNGNFLRIKNVSLTYNFNEKFTKRLKLNRMKVYMMVDNAFMFQKFKGIDAEAVDARGYDYGDGYPIPRKYTLGLDITF